MFFPVPHVTASLWNPFGSDSDPPVGYFPSSDIAIIADAFKLVDESGSGVPGIATQHYARFTRLPPAVQLVFGVNVGIFLLWALFPKFMDRHAVASMENNKKGRWWSMFVASFSHYRLYHIIGNMSVLLQFGPALVRELGQGVFAASVLSSALFSTVLPMATGRLLAWRFPKFEGFKGSAGSLGFSGVAMTLVYLYSAISPNAMVCADRKAAARRQGVTVRQMLMGVFEGDIVGLAVSMVLPTGVGHGAHLAGILCGVLLRRFLCYTRAGRRFLTVRGCHKLRRSGKLLF
ncbi:hypothetical protein B484DRAFT_482212 [Ochromonadaceae sp. CCMP2298]|nr:hypothetical protein B484DRAFT_482212 [Ochromonadaceae sp. CCMP2298]